MENLSLFLKNHIGKEFWCDLCGNVTLIDVYEDGWMKFDAPQLSQHALRIDRYGKFHENGNCIIWPDSFYRGWDEWIKTYSNLSYNDIKPLVKDKPICKQAELYDEIVKLIDIAYGGIVDAKKLNNEWEDVYFILPNPKYRGDLEIICSKDLQYITPLVFKSESFAKSFMKNDENVKMAKEFYQI